MEASDRLLVVLGEVGEILRVHHPPPPSVENPAQAALDEARVALEAAQLELKGAKKNKAEKKVADATKLVEEREKQMPEAKPNGGEPDQSALESLLEKRKTMRKGKEVVTKDKTGESMADFADAMYVDHDKAKAEGALGEYKVAPGGEPMVELLLADGGLASPCSFNAIRPATLKSRLIYLNDRTRGLEKTAAQDRMKFAARLLWGAQDRNVPGALGMANGRVGVVTKGKRMDSGGKPTQIRLRWPDGSHSKWLLVQDVKPPPSRPLSTIAQAMATVEEEKRVAKEQEEEELRKVELKAALKEARRVEARQLKDSQPAAAYFEHGEGDDDAGADPDADGDDAIDLDSHTSSKVSIANNDSGPSEQGMARAGVTGKGETATRLLGIDIREPEPGSERTTNNAVWEPDRLLAYGLFLVRDTPNGPAGAPTKAVQMIEFGHAPLAVSAQPDGSFGEEGSVDTGGSDWSQQISFNPADEREPLAQLLLAHAIDAAAASAAALSEGEEGAQQGSVVASGPATVFPRLAAAAAAGSKRAAEVAAADALSADEGLSRGSGVIRIRRLKVGQSVCSITAEDSTLGSMEDAAVMEEEESLALPIELLWQPADEREAKAGVRHERHIIWPADLIV